jgi:hypothetical protein
MQTKWILQEHIQMADNVSGETKDPIFGGDILSIGQTSDLKRISFWLSLSTDFSFCIFYFSQIQE